MRNILTEPLENIRKFAPKMQSKALVSMIRALQALLVERGEKTSVEFASDILRRQSILEGALVNRGYLKQGTENRDYIKGVFGAEKKKRIF